jgi:hypothetical protein
MNPKSTRITGLFIEGFQGVDSAGGGVEREPLATAQAYDPVVAGKADLFRAAREINMAIP